MSVAEIKNIAETKMDQSIEAFKHNLTKIRTGRANPAILDTVHVDYYGSLVPISQVANVSLLDSRTVSVQPWEKGMGAKIEKAIRDSDLGLNPSSMGDLIRVPMPPMSEERRKELTKLVRNEGEGGLTGHDEQVNAHPCGHCHGWQRSLGVKAVFTPYCGSQAGGGCPQALRPGL